MARISAPESAWVLEAPAPARRGRGRSRSSGLAPGRRAVRLLSWLVTAVGLAASGCGAAIQTGFEDAEITMAVRTALINDPELGTEAIAVTVEGGAVRLTGTVREAGLVPRAERVVRGVAGVRDVSTELEVGPPPGERSRARPGRLPSIPGPDRDQPVRLIGLGLAGTVDVTTDRTIGNRFAVGPLIRLRPRNGWGPSLGFGWTRARLESEPGQPTPLATMNIRPVMGGIEYGISSGRVATAFSLVGGYAFNSLSLDTTATGPGRAIAVEGSPVVRAGASLWVDVLPRLGVNVFGGYRVVRPQVTFASDTTIQSRRLNADSAVISIGIAYWLF